MPTPPPWWIETHDAPLAVLSSAFSSGQSAIASEPSAIASVSRYGDATEPASRWSRPMTIGAGQLARGDHLVELQAREVALLVAEPADARRQPFEVHLLGGLVEPAVQRGILGEELLDGAVGLRDVLRVARERDPAERALALGEQRPDVRRDEAGEGERPREAAELRLAPDRVAVVEDGGSGILESDHRRDLLRHRAARPRGEALGVAVGLGAPVLEGDAHRQVGERVVRARLIGDDVDRHPAQQQVAEHLGGVADDADRQRLARVLRRDDAGDRRRRGRSCTRRGSRARPAAPGATRRRRR